MIFRDRARIVALAFFLTLGVTALLATVFFSNNRVVVRARREGGCKPFCKVVYRHILQ